MIPDRRWFTKNIKASPEPLLKLIAGYQDDLIIGVECMFSWYWIADFCADHGIEFVLGHALYMTNSSGMNLNSSAGPKGKTQGSVL
jgi:hypothetical protein